MSARGDLVVVTGASGFVGAGVVPALLAAGFRVRAPLRDPARLGAGGLAPGLEAAPFPPVEAATADDWARALEGAAAVVHLAGLAHAGADPAAHDAVNHRAVIPLARAAAGRRVVLLSSVRAMAGATAPGVLTEADAPVPADAYGAAKRAAERALADAGADAVALRPVLVVGPGAKGNLAGLLRLLDTPLPLPFGALKARRSLVAREDLAAAVLLALDPARVPPGPLLVADPEPVGVAAMMALLRQGLGRPARLVPVPPALMTGPLRLLGRGAAWERLAGDLVADPARLLALGWRPATGAPAALLATARAFAARR